MSEDVELFDATNIEHAKKLAASLWAVDIRVEVKPAPDAQRVIMRVKANTGGAPVTGEIILDAAHGVTMSASGKVATADGIEMEIDPTVPPEDVPMVHLLWVAEFGGQRFGEAIIVPKDREADGMKSLSFNMVRTMLALVVNGTIGRAPVTHEAMN